MVLYWKWDLKIKFSLQKPCPSNGISSKSSLQYGSVRWHCTGTGTAVHSLTKLIIQDMLTILLSASKFKLLISILKETTTIKSQVGGIFSFCSQWSCLPQSQCGLVSSPMSDRVQNLKPVTVVATSQWRNLVLAAKFNDFSMYLSCQTDFMMRQMSWLALYNCFPQFQIRESFEFITSHPLGVSYPECLKLRKMWIDTSRTLTRKWRVPVRGTWRATLSPNFILGYKSGNSLL